MNFNKLPLDSRLIDVPPPEESGYPDELAKYDDESSIREAFGAADRDFPDALDIPESEMRERAAYNDEHDLWAGSYIDRYTNQSPTHECTSHALRCVAEACWNRQRRISLGGPEAGKRLDISAKSASVWFSCLSIYCEANPREWGGANVQQVCRIACDRGFLPDIVQPKDYGFKHTMAGTRGKGGVNQSGDNNGGPYPWPGWYRDDFRDSPDHWEDDDWRETAKHFKPLECVYPRDSHQYRCLLLHGYAIGIGRSGHSVPIIGMKWEGRRWIYPYYDSYDRLLYDSSAYYSGAYSILTMTQPDDWDKPAGQASPGA